MNCACAETRFTRSEAPYGSFSYGVIGYRSHGYVTCFCFVLFFSVEILSKWNTKGSKLPDRKRKKEKKIQ